MPFDVLKDLGGPDKLNMTRLAMNLSNYINGVAKKHGEVSKMLFPGYKIQAITNGVHTFTWTCESMARLFDKYLPGWANEPELFVRIGKAPDAEIWAAHMEAKRKLIDHVNKTTGVGMDYDTLTIGFARRATAYKRANLLFYDTARLKKIGKRQTPDNIRRQGASERRRWKAQHRGDSRPRQGVEDRDKDSLP